VRKCASAQVRKCASAQNIVLIALMSSTCSLVGQALSRVSISTKGEQTTMSSYLNGAGRNHIAGLNGVTTNNITETRFDEKVKIYSQLDNYFSNSGNPIYRIGHNISDGNMAWQWDGGAPSFASYNPGWHWARQYGDGRNQEYIATILHGQLGNPPGSGAPNVISALGQPNNSPSITARLAAGANRFVFLNNQTFAGFVVNINYRNSISLRRFALPSSQTLPIGSQVPDLIPAIRAATDVGNVIQQVGGPAPTIAVWTGGGWQNNNNIINVPSWYEMNYRITNAAGDVAFWSVILSFADLNSGTRVARTNADELHFIDPTPSLFPVGTSAQVRHSKIVTVNAFRDGNGTIDLNNVYDANDPQVLQFGLADETGGYIYDDLRFTIEEAQRLKADLAVCVNIGTGFPEEAAGLIEYLHELGAAPAFVELGSELMGDWNKGHQFSQTPGALGQNTLAFAQHIKFNQNPLVSSTLIATTSTYSYTLEFYGGPFATATCGNGAALTQIGNRVNQWIQPFMNGNECLIDFVNIHTYPTNDIKSRDFSEEKSIDLFAAIDHFKTDVLDEVRAGLACAGVADQVGIVITESNTAWCTEPWAVSNQFQCNDQVRIAQQHTITEAIYFAENFTASAENEIEALIPFAFTEQGVLATGVNFNIQNGDPSHPASWFRGNEDPQQNIHFYLNTGATQDEVFVKPTFKAKQIIFKNLGSTLLPDAATIDCPNLFSATLSRTFESLTVLPTIDRRVNEIALLVINKDPMVGGFQDVEFTIDNTNLRNPQLMFLCGQTFSDKQPIYSTNLGNPLSTDTLHDYPVSTPGLPNALAFNHGMPEFIDATPFLLVINGVTRLRVPNMSICVLRSRLDVRPQMTCVPPVLVPLSCNQVQVQLSPSPGTSPASYGLYYRENLDLTGVIEPNTFDPNDPTWIHFGDSPVGTNNAIITGLQFPQDNYQIAVVSRYLIQQTGFVGPALDSVICVSSFRTLSCENCSALNLQVVPQSTLLGAISSGTLLPKATAFTTGQNVLFTNPNFTIDDDYTFFGSNLYFNADVSLTIRGKELTIKSSKLSGCEMLWQGIKNEPNTQGGKLTITESTIQDAKEAFSHSSVMANSNGLFIVNPYFTVFFDGVQLIRNSRAIVINGKVNQSGKTELFLNNNSVFKNLTIDGTAFNLKPEQGSIFTARAKEGIFVSRGKVLSFGQFLPSTILPVNASLRITNVANPMRIEDSRSISINSIHIDNRNYDFMHYPSAYRGAIAAYRTGYVNVRNANHQNQAIRGAIAALEMVNCPTAQATGVRSDSIDIGFVGFGNSTTNLSNNEFVTRAIGISLSQSPTHSVTNNRIFQTGSTPVNLIHNSPNGFGAGSIGIGVYFPATPIVSPVSEISGNTIGVKPKQLNIYSPQPDISVGILSFFTNAENIHHNSVFLQNDDPSIAEPRFYGLYKANSTNAKICANTITGLQGLDRGIGSHMSPGAISCNKIDLTRHALYFEGDNEAGNSVRGNELNSAVTGVFVNSLNSFPANLGIQDHQANRWQNNWLFGGFWQGNRQFLDDSRFLNSPTQPFSPAVPVVPPSDWFIPFGAFNNFNNCLETAGVFVPNCPTQGPPGGGGAGEGGVGRIASAANTLQEPYRSIVLRSELQKIQSAWLDMNQAPRDIQDFVSNTRNSQIGKLSQIDAIIADPLKDNPDLKLAIIMKQAEIAGLQQSQDAHHEFLQGLSDTQYSQWIIQGTQPANSVQYQNLQSELSKLLIDASSIQIQAQNDALGENNIFAPQDAFQQLEKELNQILITHAQAGELKPTQTDFNTILEIANRCPQEWGWAVYKARAIYHQWGGGFERAWQDCFPIMESETPQGKSILQSGQVASKPETSETDAILVYPVPLADQFRISIPAAYSGAEYQVVSSTGTVILSGKLHELQTELDCTVCSNGLYLVRVNHPLYRPITRKIVIQKL
jgi:hypothetical protein